MPDPQPCASSGQGYNHCVCVRCVIAPLLIWRSWSLTEKEWGRTNRNPTCFPPMVLVGARQRKMVVTSVVRLDVLANRQDVRNYIYQKSTTTSRLWFHSRAVDTCAATLRKNLSLVPKMLTETTLM